MTESEMSQTVVWRNIQCDQYEQQGIGLGLVIAQLFVETYGGDLNIQSQFGKSTTLGVILPQTLS